MNTPVSRRHIIAGLLLLFLAPLFWRLPATVKLMRSPAVAWMTPTAPPFFKPNPLSPIAQSIPSKVPDSTSAPAPKTNLDRLPPGVLSKTALADSYDLLPVDRSQFLSFVDRNGIERLYRPGVLLGKFKDDPKVYAFGVATGKEIEIQTTLKRSKEIAFAELDMVMKRQFQPNDEQVSTQWHHATIHSTNAWALTLGNNSIKVAILDTPFQMNHPDLAARTIPGWDMVFQQPIDSAVGFYHSTIGAGLAGASVNNFIGVAGAVNCQIMPINIGDFPTLSDMHKAVLWAADHDVRIVNISWDGCFSSVVNESGAYLKSRAGGLLFMAGVNGFNRFLDYPNQPDIYAVSMTDSSDAPRSTYGPHIDFSAPGYQIFSTTTNSGYELDSGSSYSTPLTAGLAAFILSVNPALTAEQTIDLLKAGAVDLGTAGWDQYFGWGRLDFGKIARAAFATLPISRIKAEPNFTIQTEYLPGVEYVLLRSANAAQWQLVQDYSIVTNGPSLFFRDNAPTSGPAYYQIQVRLP